MKVHIQFDNGDVLERTADTQRITSWGGTVLDESWVGTDSHGHEHRGSDLDATLRYREHTTVVIEEDGYPEEYDDVWWECRICGDEVEPGMKTVPPTYTTVVGAMDYTLNGQPITPDEAERILAEHKADMSGQRVIREP